jgi:hypothetical protein
MANGFPRKVMFVPDEITEISDTLRKLKLDNNLLGNDPIVVYDRQGREQEKIEPLSFAGRPHYATPSSVHHATAHATLTRVSCVVCRVSCVSRCVRIGMRSLKMLTDLSLSQNNLHTVPRSLCHVRYTQAVFFRPCT